jgi:hypothetical protein
MQQVVQQAKPGDTSTYTVQVVNLGNLATFLHVEAGPGVTAPATWPDTPMLPNHVHFLNVTYLHNEGAGRSNAENSFTLNLTPYAAVDATMEGPTVNMNALARTRGTPAAAMPLVLARLGLAAVAARRKER